VGADIDIGAETGPQPGEETAAGLVTVDFDATVDYAASSLAVTIAASQHSKHSRAIALEEGEVDERVQQRIHGDHEVRQQVHFGEYARVVKIDSTTHHSPDVAARHWFSHTLQCLWIQSAGQAR
jgi:hypothetical protein